MTRHESNPMLELYERQLAHDLAAMAEVWSRSCHSIEWLEREFHDVLGGLEPAILRTVQKIAARYGMETR